VATCFVLLLASATTGLLAQEAPKTDTAAVAGKSATDTAAAVKLPAEQLDALVAPIALYPDALLAQTLVASTYPLELIQLHQWMAKHKDLKDKALADSVAKQPWDPSIQTMAAVPDLVKRLADDIQWTTNLGNAFLAQQEEVMDAVQRMRAKAKSNGALESNEQQKVETKKVEGETIIIVQQTNPEVVYVPSYNPTYVYGPPVYPYPPVYYPPYTAGAAFVSFSFGFMMGAAMWGGSCCYAGWGGGNSIYINNSNNFNKIGSAGGVGGVGGAGGVGGVGGAGGVGGVGGVGGAGRPKGAGGNWSHNPSHRGGAPYGDRATANKFGGASAGTSDRAGGRGQGGAAASNRASPSQGGAGASNRAGSGGPSASSSNRAGSRDMPSSGSRSNGFSGGSSGFSGSSARASSSRGASSMGSRGGGSRGGGGGRRR
jgi:hypothetical protein